MSFDIDEAMNNPFYCAGPDRIESNFCEMTFEDISPTFYHDDPCGWDTHFFTLNLEQLKFVKNWCETHIKKLEGN